MLRDLVLTAGALLLFAATAVVIVVGCTVTIVIASLP